ncbi:PREDICTED: testis- and ovary-specific PAZ domain-containing protein 1 [Fulmarus glacialis]|uniref:testis- and ovary-specific PAZ domain-containing protein 1 n=1 Tax=Fulmarus glacialis TaxID=30455 RepID=UPI00051B6A48|nr:PREDICTED: testis- and ovary-specific PAZ domain-containing protein 1 [Fulmarus glacialis]
MPQLRSGKVVTASKVKSADRMVTSPNSLGVGVGHEPGKKLVVKHSPHLSPKRKPEQPLSSCLQPAMLSSVSSEQFAPLVPMQKEQGESSQRLPGKKNKGIQCRRAARSNKGVALPISDTDVCEDWQAATMAAATCWEETVRRGTEQGQQLFFSGTTLQNKFSAGIERKEHSSEGLDLSGFQEGSGSSEKKGKYSFMEIKLQIPSSEEEIESTERHGISCLLEPEELRPRKGTCSTEMKSADSITILKMQIPDLKKNLGTQESLSEPKPHKEVDTPEKLHGCSLIGSRKPGTQKGKRCLSKKNGTSLIKPKLQGPRERGRSALLELHTQCPESKKGAVSLRKRDRNALVSQRLQRLSGQEQPTTRGKMRKRCMKEEQQSSNPEKGADSLGESAKEKWKAIEQDSGVQAVKKLKTNRNRSEDSKEKEPHYSQSPTVATSGGTQSKRFLSQPVTKKSDVQYKKRKPRIDQIKYLQSFSVTTAEKMRNVPAKCHAEYCRNALNHCNGLLCATEKNPFVRLEACSYINTFVKSSASGTTSSYKLSGFFHVAQDKRKHVFPDGTVEQCDVNCSTSRMQNERSPITGGLLFNKEKTQNGEGCFSFCQSENSKCLRGKKWNIGRKPRKKMKITEKSVVQDIFIDMANECSECELQTETAVAVSSSFAVLGLNRKEITLSASCDHTSDLHIGKNTHEAQNTSVWRKNSTKLLSFEDGFKKPSELSVITKGEISNSVAHHSAASGSLRVLAQVHDVSNCHKSKTDEKLNKVNKKLQQFTCRRTIPMTGKNGWLFESCARTSEWVHKNHGSISEGKRLSRAAFEESSDKSSVKATGSSAVTGNLRRLDLHMSLAEINEESTHKIMDPNAECLTSLETPESSSMDTYETLRTSNENVESPLNTDRSAMDFSRDDVQEVKATLNFTTKQEDKGAVTKRNLSVTVQNGTSTGNKNRINFSRKASVVNRTFSDLKLTKVLNSGNLTKFKIPLCRNKPESRKLESVCSFERKSCSPLELLDSTSVSRRQKTGEETFLVYSKQQPLSVASDAMSTASMKKKADEIDSKDFQHDGSENLSNEMSALPEHFSLYPHPFLDRQIESSVPDFRGTECVLEHNFPDLSWNAVDHSVALEINDDSKTRGNLSQHKSQNFPDILEAYKEDVLVIDVIQDDPDLFGTNNEEELALADCENCPVKASHTSICIKDEKQNLKPEYPLISENRDSVDDNFRHITIQESEMSNDTENSCDWVLTAKDTKTHNSRGSSPLGRVPEDFLEDGQLRELDELLKSFDVDEKASHSVQQILEMIELPRKYCRFYFMTLRGCERAKCWFWHVPEQGDEKICMAILRTYISIKESGLLKRAVQIFVKYYKEVTPGVDFASQVLNDLLISLLKNCLLREVFQILNVTVRINTLPAVDVLLKVFEHVASLNIRDAVPTLISTFCKLIDAGMFLEFEHFDYIIKFLHQLQVSSQEINTVLNIKSRFQERHSEKNWLFDFNLAVAEIQHCKEKSDWTKLGALYVNARTGCEHFDDLQKLSLCIAEILTRDSETDRPGVPFCDFADAVIKNSQHNEADRIFIGRIGISVMYCYHKALQWIKGRKVLDKLHELQIDFTVLKGLIGTERLASRCQIVNKAAEIFLKTGSLDGATWVLRESDWTTNAPLWPCDKVDILNRHNLLRTLVHKYLTKSLYRQAFEVLQNLPGFQNHSDTVDVSQYSCLFNKLINACFESKNLGVSSSAVDFMLSKNIAIDFFLLRGLITALGRSSLWSKARTYYKSALSLGCYPPLQGNLYHKLLTIPSYLSEVEMLLAIEIFLVSNASDIQSPMATSQTLQIILKRCEDQTVQNNSDYQAAVERLILAARVSDPKLFLKHMTMNVNMEEVYSLELTSALKWLQENMKWAGKVWLFQ